MSINEAVPSIIAERLNLSGIATDDVRNVFAYASDPEVAKNTSWLPHIELADSLGYINFMLLRTSSEPDKRCYCWAIRLHGQSSMIGTIDFIQSSPSQGRIDFALAKQHWNKGLMTEAAMSVVNWAFSNIPQLMIIESGGLTENRVTSRVLEKCGMDVKRRYDYSVRKLGVIKEVTEYQIAKEDWVKK